MSSNIGENKLPVSFFTSLRRLGRQVDSGVKDAHQALEKHEVGNNASLGEEVNAITLKQLLDYRRDMAVLKKNARGYLTDMRHKSSVFEKCLQKCQEVIDEEFAQLTGIQCYLQQYGYVPMKANSNLSDVCEDKVLTSSDRPLEDEKLDNSDENKSPISITPKNKTVLASKMTPRLEDYGISHFTLHMMNHPVQHHDNYSTAEAKWKKANNDQGRIDVIPTPFQNKGLIVTPSLFPNFRRVDTYSLSILCSPDFQMKPALHTKSWVERSPEQQTKLVKMLKFPDSPLPPLLHTPGTKQIPHLSQFVSLDQNGSDHCTSPVPPVLLTPGIKQIPTGKDMVKSLTVNQSEFLNSPIPPVLQTAGIKQIPTGRALEFNTVPPCKSHGAAKKLKLDGIPGRGVLGLGADGIGCNVKGQVEGTTSDHLSLMEPLFNADDRRHELEIPKSPELTFSLSDLQKMTDSLKNFSLASIKEGSPELNTTQLPTVHTQDVQHHKQHNHVTSSGPRHETLSVSPMPHLTLHCTSMWKDALTEPSFPKTQVDKYSFTADPGSGYLPYTPEFKSTFMTGGNLQLCAANVSNTQKGVIDYSWEISDKDLQSERKDQDRDIHHIKIRSQRKSYIPVPDHSSRKKENYRFGYKPDKSKEVFLRSENYRSQSVHVNNNETQKDSVKIRKARPLLEHNFN